MESQLIGAIVLAGGKGSRLGRDKLSEMVGDRSLLQRVIDVLGQLSKHILVVTAQGQVCPNLRTTRARVVVVTDIYPEKGALGGIYTGLAASDSWHNLVLAADMPFLNPRLLRYLADVSPDFDIVMPRIRGQIEPLHAVYGRRCLPIIQQQLARKELQIRGVLKEAKVRYVEESEIERFDPRYLSFFNVNTPEELARAKEIATEIDGV